MRVSVHTLIIHSCDNLLLDVLEIRLDFGHNSLELLDKRLQILSRLHTVREQGGHVRESLLLSLELLTVLCLYVCFLLVVFVSRCDMVSLCCYAFCLYVSSFHNELIASVFFTFLYLFACARLLVCMHASRSRVFVYMLYICLCGPFI